MPLFVGLFFNVNCNLCKTYGQYVNKIIGDYQCGFQRKPTSNYIHSAVISPLKPELNPICYLLALLGAHHFLHVSRIRVKLLTLR